MIADVNSILRAYLVTCGALTSLIGGATPRIYCPRLPEGCLLPAVGFFVRGGRSSSYIAGIISPSFQIDSWAITPLVARQVYRALYDNLQGLERTAVVVGGNTYYILGASEEVQGMDLQDAEIPNYYRCLTFFSVMIRAE